MITKTDRKMERIRRHKRVRTKISGTPECPRLCVFRSNTNVYAKEVGTLVAKRALEKNIKAVVYDRGGYIYHGVVQELAEAAREAGLEF